MESSAPKSLRERSSTLIISGHSPDDWKKLLREVKSLYARRRYKQCATLSTDLLRQFEGQLHVLYESFLHYYAAASYETMGHIAHNFSTNKIPLLCMAKDFYVSCKISLGVALKEFKAEQNRLAAAIENLDGVFADPSTRLTSHSAVHNTFKGSIYPWSDQETNSRSQPSDDEAAFNIGNGRTCYSSPFSSPEDGDSDQLQMSDRAELMPPPLSIRKTYPDQHPFINSPVPKIPTSNSRLLPKPSAWAPHFSLSPLRPTGNTQESTGKHDRLSMDHVSVKEKQTHCTRIVNLVTSLSDLVAGNISSVNCLIKKTAELQRVHNATKSKRFASFWSFTPEAELPSPTDNVKYNSVSDSSTKSSRTWSSSVSSATTATTVSTGCTGVDNNKQQRIERLRAEGWRTVGLRDPERGWKGSEYYQELCGKALAELYGY
ncbi:hypothetical protein VTO42DRAFT_4810 [Malbranchea cinnamomea]